MPRKTAKKLNKSTKNKEKIDKVAKITLSELIKTTGKSFLLCFRLVPKLTIQLVVVVLAVPFFPLLQNGLFGKIINEISAAVGTSDLTTSTTSTTGQILFFVLLYILVSAISYIVNEILAFLEKRWDLVTDHELNIYSMRKRSALDIAHYEDPEFQNLMYKAFDNGTWPIHALARKQVDNIANIFGIITASAIILTISPTLLIVSLLCAVPHFIIELQYGYNMWGIWSENSHRQRLYYALRDHLQKRQNIVQTKMLQAVDRLLGDITTIMKGYLSDQLRVDKRRLWLGIGSSAFMAIGIGYGIYHIVGEVISGTILAGTLVFAITSLQSLIATINKFLTDIAEQYRRALTARDMFTVYQTTPIIIDKKNSTSIDLSAPPLIEFKNVNFAYSGGSLILKNLSFTIEPGQKVGIVGQNGAGKSTLIKLLMRVYDPTEGQILVNGIDLRNISVKAWTATLSVLLQQYSLHEYDVAKSIAMGLPDATFKEEGVFGAAKLSGADEFITEYPRGYKQQLSREFDDGVEPSQGQMQKIALARSLYRLGGSGQILVLDEPTAAIDPLAELEIFEKMEVATEGKSLILITHRFNSVKNVDKIIVLDHGAIAEQGTHEQLMSRVGLYSEMFRGQAKGFIEGVEVVDNESASQGLIK